MDDSHQLLPVKSDFVFKLIFGDQRNTDILAKFLGSVLDIPELEYEKLTITDPYVKKESESDKFGILDVKLYTKSGRVVHIEIQVLPIPNMAERSIYYLSKMVAEQLSSGSEYNKIKQVVSIIVTDYNMTEDNGIYHNRYRLRSAFDSSEYTDLIEIDLLELPKLPVINDGSELWHWLRFMDCQEEEVLNMLEEHSPELKKAVGVLKELSEDERTRMLFEDQEKARRDWASRMSGARREGREEGQRDARIDIANKLIDMGLSTEQIETATGLSREEVEALQ